MTAPILCGLRVFPPVRIASTAGIDARGRSLSQMNLLAGYGYGIRRSFLSALPEPVLALL